MTLLVLRNRIFTSAYGKGAYRSENKKRNLKGKPLWQKIILWFILENHKNQIYVERTRKRLYVYYFFMLFTLVIILLGLIEIDLIGYGTPLRKVIVDPIFYLWFLFMIVVLRKSD